MTTKQKYMEEVIKKWELVLRQDKDRDVTYGRKVIEEILNNLKQKVKKETKCDREQDKETIKLHLLNVCDMKIKEARAENYNIEHYSLSLSFVEGYTKALEEIKNK
ncbi:MAG: hypothetical protein WC389_08880 [Lutibacter sp.]|jgi:hypothetical protein